MDSIKKKMQSLANETANATARAERWEKEVARINATADQYEEQVGPKDQCLRTFSPVDEGKTKA